MSQGGTPELEHAYAVRLMQHLVVPTFVIDPQRRVVIWNRACERLTGVAASEVLGTSMHWRAFYREERYCLADLVTLDRPDQLTALYSQYVDHGANGENGVGFSAENWCVMPKLGNQLYLAIDAGPIHDEAGNLIAVVETLRDITAQKQAEMALQALAAKDGLTGLGNRRSFDSALKAEWSRAQQMRTPVTLLFVDVDHFKLFNDRHGHQLGDECLRAVAALIGEATCRPTDQAARYGGEEFAIVLSETDRDGAWRIAERIRRAVAELRIPHGAPGAGTHVTLSVGVASCVPDAGLCADWLLGQADQALYAAKHLGRDRVICADTALADFARAGKADASPAPRGVAARKA